MAQPHADRNMLFGILALQLDFISRDALVAGMNAWVLDKHKPLGQILVEQQALAAPNREALEVLVDRHLEHHGQLQDSLAAVSIPPDLHQDLAGVADAELHASLAGIPTTVPPHGTGVHLAGVSTGRRGTGEKPIAVGEPSSSGLRFRVLRPHAEGGLGKVSVARDGELNRDVALKEIKPVFAEDAEARARFLAEAEITGGLEHPGVVPVYGLGRYADGRPFYAMRFIHGDSLLEAIGRFHAAEWTKKASERSLALRGLLRRFVDVCNAVAYAHSRGVVHRDLKPANVMLGPYGETLLVDWGLAKPLPLEEGKTSPPEGFLRPSSGDGMATQAGAVVGTPSYMPPEQAGGKRVGPAADVYGLGATLYHLLSGRAPFGGTDPLDILMRVVQGQCQAAREVNAAVPVALSAVCQKAMALQPQERYGSAKELAAEVERWLADEPVAAYREPWRVRLGRWGRRHRDVVAGLVMLLLTGVVGLGLGLWAVRAEQRKTAWERDQAEANLRLAESNLALAKQAVDECFGIAKEHPLLHGEEMQAIKELLLQKALLFYGNFRVQRPEDPAIQEEMAGIAFRVGYITSEIGQKSEALAAYREAMHLYTALAEKHPEVTKYQANLAGTYNLLGCLQSATGDQAGALHSYQEALRLFSALAKTHSQVPQYQADLASTHHNLGASQLVTGDRAGALRSYQEALRLKTTLAKTQPEVTEYQADLARTHNNLGLLQHETGDRAGALQSIQEALRLWTTLFEKHPEVTRYQADLGSSYCNLGSLQRETGDRTGALRSYQEVLRVYTTLAEKHPEVTRYQAQLAASHVYLGLLQSETGDRAAAVRSYQEALRLQSALADKYPEVPVYRAHLAGTHNNLGLLQRETGDRAGALRSYQEALRLQSALAEKHPEVPVYQADLARTHNNLGLLQCQTGDRVGALRSYQEALRLFAALSEKHPEVTRYQDDLGSSYYDLGDLQRKTGDRVGAFRSYQEALRLYAALAEKHPEVARYQAKLAASHVYLGLLQDETGDRAAALRAYQEALRLYTALAEKHSEVIKYSVELAGTLVNIGLVLYDEGKPKDSLAEYAQAIRTLDQVRRRLPDDPTARLFLRNAHAGRAKALTQLGHHAEAAADWGQALTLDEGPRRAEFRFWLADALARAGEHARATAQAAEFDRLPALRGDDCYNLACVWSLSSAAARKDAQLPAAKQAKLAEQYAGRALDWLRKAQDAGYFKNPAKIAHMKKDNDLDPLRPRDDFKKFLAELETKPKDGK
jgi:serine/threonine-protein kinase